MPSWSGCSPAAKETDVKPGLAEVRERRHQEARAWKERSGGKVVGLFCCSVPEELIHAAGMLPVRLLGEHEDTSEADIHFPVNVCPYPKACFDQALKGRYDYLDGMVVPNVCDMVRAMLGFWQTTRPLPFLYFLEVPQKISPESTGFFTVELRRFRKALESLGGSPIGDDAIRDAIRLFNADRALLRELSALRVSAGVAGSLVQDATLAAMVLPKQRHLELMEAALAGARAAPRAEGLPLFLSASMLDESDFVRLIEESGGRVVADDMPAGTRYFQADVDEADPDPLRALARRYLEEIPCPRKMRPEAHLARLLDLLEGSGARGVVIHNLRACDCHLYEYPYFKRELEARGMSILFFRGEETATELEQQRADIEAFVEMIGE
jgi:benzoyl-CoA reductase subunit C